MAGIINVSPSRTILNKFSDKSVFDGCLAAYKAGYVDSEVKREEIPVDLIRLYKEFIELVNSSMYWKDFLCKNINKSYQAYKTAANELIKNAKEERNPKKREKTLAQKNQMYEDVKISFKAPTRRLDDVYGRVNQKYYSTKLQHLLMSAGDDVDAMIEKATTDTQRQKINDLFVLSEFFFEFCSMLEVFKTDDT